MNIVGHFSSFSFFVLFFRFTFIPFGWLVVVEVVKKLDYNKNHKSKSHKKYFFELLKLLFVFASALA
jgi:hypothetical protein